MATIDYKEKYEQALEVAQRFYNNSVAITNKGIEDIFPELKESEDERIRKAIYNCVKWFGFDSCFFKDVAQEEFLRPMIKVVGISRILNIGSMLSFQKK